MKIQDINKVIKSSKVIVHKGRYAYLKTKEKVLGNHFMISQDKDEITIITEEKNVRDTKYEKDVKWFKLFEVKVSVPFLAGFLAKVLPFVANKGLNTLVVSTFSKDYILTKEETFETAVDALREAGFQVNIE